MKEGTENEWWQFRHGTAGVRRGMTIKLLQVCLHVPSLPCEVIKTEGGDKKTMINYLRESDFPQSCLLPTSLNTVCQYFKVLTATVRDMDKSGSTGKLIAVTVLFQENVRRTLFGSTFPGTETLTNDLDLVYVLLERILLNENMWLIQEDANIVYSSEPRSFRFKVDEEPLQGTYEFRTEDHECMVDHFNDWFDKRFNKDDNQPLQYARRHIDMLEKMGRVEKVDESDREIHLCFDGNNTRLRWVDLLQTQNTRQSSRCNPYLNDMFRE